MSMRQGNPASIDIQSLLDAAAARQDHPGYAGNLSAAEAWDVLSALPDAQLVDVRSETEWQWVGIPYLASIAKQAVLLPWQKAPNFEPNVNFLHQLAEQLPNPHVPLLMLCRTGGRSRSAAIAATQAGFTQAYNITDGFEGPHNTDGQRGTLKGWKASGLPWQQA